MTATVSTAGCGASAILARGGPTAVPFDMCCVMAIMRAAGPDPDSFVCGALELLEFGESEVPERIAEAAP